MRVIRTRHAREGNRVIVETATYIKAGETGLFSIEDPRGHELPGEDGKWMALSIINFLGVLEEYAANKYHVDFSLRSGVQLITSSDYDVEIINKKQLIQDQRDSQLQSKKSKNNRLKAMYKAGKLFPDDAQTFEDTYGFNPDG